MNWRQEQEQFWSWINQPQDLDTQANEIASLLAPHSHLSQAEALSIYNNAYHQRLVEVSSALFPILFNTLGRDIYTRLWIGYMGKYPPRNGPIHRVGEFLRDYVSSHEQFSNLPAVADIIHMEGLLISLFDVADEAAYTLAELQSLPAEKWPAMRWQAKQDWALLESRFNLEKYWQQMHGFMASGGEPGEAEFGIELVKRPEDEGTIIREQNPLLQRRYPSNLIYRKRHRMQFQPIAADMALFLQAVREGETFAQICEHLAAAFPMQDIPQLSLNLLFKAIELGLLCSSNDRVNAN
ncbi:MAG: putative DNA-binding domain-containing protein [Gammaproteobacteria bacterium]|nr:putative DNA-binding domain-containing protein [Gammaproteobacteria bacterium]